MWASCVALNSIAESDPPRSVFRGWGWGGGGHLRHCAMPPLLTFIFSKKNQMLISDWNMPDSL